MQISLEQLRQYLRHKHQLEIIEQSRLLQLTQDAWDLRFLSEISPSYLADVLRLLPHSQAQLRQDLFVLSVLGAKRKGFFVEFGAGNGHHWSNSHLLEKHCGWSGILSEPAKIWHSDLLRNRSCIIDVGCVWKETGATIVFNETSDPIFSTIDLFSDKDKHRQERVDGKRYSVSTISLMDLLQKYDAPNHMEYLSIDTEGSEFDILSAFDFSSYSFSVITCEHNYTKDREKIHSLLAEHGYVRSLKELSRFDDWYVHSSLYESLCRKGG